MPPPQTREWLLQWWCGSRRRLPDTGQPIIGPLNQHLGMNLFACLELLKLLFVLDGVFHGHGRHPTLNFFSLYGGELRGRVHPDHFATHWILDQRLRRGIMATPGYNDRAEQEPRFHLVTSAVLLGPDFVTSLDGSKRRTVASAGTPRMTVPPGSWTGLRSKNGCA